METRIISVAYLLMSVCQKVYTADKIAVEQRFFTNQLLNSKVNFQLNLD